MSRNGTGYSYVGATEVKSVYCPICATLSHRGIPSIPSRVQLHELCCSTEHMALYRQKIIALEKFIRDVPRATAQIKKHAHAGRIYTSVYNQLSVADEVANLIDIIEIVKGRVQLRKDVK